MLIKAVAESREVHLVSKMSSLIDYCYYKRIERYSIKFFLMMNLECYIGIKIIHR